MIIRLVYFREFTPTFTVYFTSILCSLIGVYFQLLFCSPCDSVEDPLFETDGPFLASSELLSYGESSDGLHHLVCICLTCFYVLHLLADGCSSIASDPCEGPVLYSATVCVPVGADQLAVPEHTLEHCVAELDFHWNRWLCTCTCPRLKVWCWRGGACEKCCCRPLWPPEHKYKIVEQEHSCKLYKNCQKCLNEKLTLILVALINVSSCGSTCSDPKPDHRKLIFCC